MRAVALVWLCAACTDAGAVGEVFESRSPDAAVMSAPAAAAPAPQPSGADAAVCPLGICELAPLCDPELAFCLFCNSDADCADNAPDTLCSIITSTCVECRNHSDCPARAPFCEGGECGVCADDDDCGGDMNCNDGVCEPD